MPLLVFVHFFIARRVSFFKLYVEHSGEFCAVSGKCHCGGLEMSGTRVRRDSVAVRVKVAQFCRGRKKQKKVKVLKVSALGYVTN